MAIDPIGVRRKLKDFAFTSLLVEELGWDRHRAAPLLVDVGGVRFTLTAVAEKRGMVVFECSPAADGAIPPYPIRRKIEQKVSRAAYEHLIIFTDSARTNQVWQWVKRDAGRTPLCREHVYNSVQSGEALVQKLDRLAFELEEEESLAITEVASRVRGAMDVDRLTKRFYERFKAERDRFMDFITGIPTEGDRAWYTSLMLNRLMFIYFIQKKRFLDDDPDYLKNRLRRTQAAGGRDTFHRFYRFFLLKLFHDGLSKPKPHDDELVALLGNVPYLNGGLFDVHDLERAHTSISIPDEAFEKIFAFFDAYHWHLDDRPLRADNEINPDVLGYIFEKYINQRQMGAYYTKEDITGYIARNAILPYLFRQAQKSCPLAFSEEAGVWRRLDEEPNRYIRPELQYGMQQDVPADVARGLDDPSERVAWNRPAPESFGLPTETWREYMTRRARYLDVRSRISKGEVRSIEDFTTENLDIEHFVRDVIDQSEGPELVRAFWSALRSISILDPTCGSGAFLFASLNVLQPLYESCIDAMEGFVSDLERTSRPTSAASLKTFRDVLAEVGRHPNRGYFVLKSIVINNLFGVDLMEEAVEICKLRLFLKLVSQITDGKHIEPLPDIDFNVRPGNTLVGYSTYDAVRASVSSKLNFDNVAQRIDTQALELQRAFDAFRTRQVEGDGFVPPALKQDLRDRLRALDDELDQHLAGDYGIDTTNHQVYEAWQKSHEPFHWLVEFYGIMARGGFDVIIGNPPWKEYAAVKKQYAVRGYQTEKSGNLYALCIERSLQLAGPSALFSFIVQLPLASSSRMASTRELLREQSAHLTVITCDDRPGKLFDGLEHCRSCIFIARKQNDDSTRWFFTTKYNRWFTQARRTLFNSLEFAAVPDERLFRNQFPKLDNRYVSIFKKLSAHERNPIGVALAKRATDHFIFYQESAQYWIKATVGTPYYAKNGRVGAPAHGRYLYFHDSATAHGVCAILNSSLFYSYFIAYGDCFHLSDALVTGFPASLAAVGDKQVQKLSMALMKDLVRNATRTVIQTKGGDEIAYDQFSVTESKAIIDEIDRMLATHYGFTSEELDSILNFDVKYRMGQQEGDD